MTSREELHALIEQVQSAALDDIADVLRQYLPREGERPYPRSIGILSSAPEDLSERVDDYLAEGFAS